MKKIDILIGDNAYGSVIHFSKSLSQAFERCGVATRLFWIGDHHFFHAYYAIMADPPDLTCSFSDISLDRKPLGDLWQIPHLSFLVDPPIYFLHQFTGKYGWVSCVDTEDCAFVRALNFPRVFFLPHAAEAQLQTPVKKNRPLDTVFFGTCLDYQAIAKGWPKEERDLLLAASEKVLSAGGQSILQALLELGVQQIDLPRYHAEVDRYTRGKDRIELIRSLQGHSLHIWGEGPWEKYFPQHQLHPPLPFEQTLKIMQESKMVLNSSPRFKAGAHERIFYALMCGACVYTGENVFLTTHLPEVFTYCFGKWERPSFTHWQERAESAQQRVLANHTWDVRAATLLNFENKDDSH
jgi:spore maturation protein CgeB